MDEGFQSIMKPRSQTPEGNEETKVKMPNKQTSGRLNMKNGRENKIM